MLTMSDWIFVLKNLGCRRTKAEIRRLIIEQCLTSKERIYGVYQVDSNKVWHYFVENDPICLKEATDKRIADSLDIESWLESIKYQRIRKTYPRNHHKKGR